MTWFSATFFCFLDRRYCHFDTSEIIEAEQQVVLNTFPEHDFKDAFKFDRCTGNSVYAWNRTTS
jgi:hypothetical protein